VTTHATEEDRAYETFKKLRWPESCGQAFCPKCKCKKVYVLAARKEWRCSSCSYQFSATSGTVFAGRKMSYEMMIKAMNLLAAHNGAISALALSRSLRCQYPTAWLIVKRVKEWKDGNSPLEA
jgi:transposase-like protein